MGPHVESFDIGTRRCEWRCTFAWCYINVLELDVLAWQALATKECYTDLRCRCPLDVFEGDIADLHFRRYLQVAIEGKEIN